MREGLGPERGLPHTHPQEQAPGPSRPPALPLPAANQGPVTPVLLDRVHLNLIIVPALLDICPIGLQHRFPCGQRCCTLTITCPTLQALWGPGTSIVEPTCSCLQIWELPREPQKISPSKILLAEERSQLRKSLMPSMYTGLCSLARVSHTLFQEYSNPPVRRASSQLVGGFVGIRGRKTTRNPERENRKEFRGTNWVCGLACGKGTIPTDLSLLPCGHPPTVAITTIRLGAVWGGKLEAEPRTPGASGQLWQKRDRRWEDGDVEPEEAGVGWGLETLESQGYFQKRQGALQAPTRCLGARKRGGRTNSFTHSKTPPSSPAPDSPRALCRGPGHLSFSPVR